MSILILYFKIGSQKEENWQGDSAVDCRQPEGGFIPARPGDPLCPVVCFEKHVSKRSSKAPDRLYLKPKQTWKPSDSVWYTAAVVGKNVLGNLMKVISEEAKLSKGFFIGYEY